MSIQVSHELVDEAAALRHGAVLARLGGTSAVTPQAVAFRCQAPTSALPAHLRSERELRRRVSPLAAAKMAEAMAEAVEGLTSGEEILRAVGRSYIDFAVTQPGLFELAMFAQSTMANTRSAEARGSADRTPYEHLMLAFSTLVLEERVNPEQANATALTCWSGVHGFATLVTQGPMRSADEATVHALADQIVERLVHAALTDMTSPAPTPAALV